MIPTKKDWDNLLEERKRINYYRDRFFQLMLEDLELFRKLKLIDDKKYWKQRLKYNLIRYNIKIGGKIYEKFTMYNF